MTNLGMGMKKGGVEPPVPGDSELLYWIPLFHQFII